MELIQKLGKLLDQDFPLIAYACTGAVLAAIATWAAIHALVLWMTQD